MQPVENSERKVDADFGLVRSKTIQRNRSDLSFQMCVTLCHYHHVTKNHHHTNHCHNTHNQTASSSSWISLLTENHPPQREDFHEVRIHLLAGLSATHDGDDNDDDDDDDTRRSVKCIKSYVPGSREGGSG